LWTIPCAVVAAALTFLLPYVGIEAEIARHAQRFTLGQLPSMFFIVGLTATRGYLAARHRTLILIVAALVANVVNVAVCNLLVRGDAALTSIGLPAIGAPPMGSLGAGVALSVASLVQFLVVVAYARAIAPVNRARGVDAAKVMHLGLPIGLHLVAEYGAFSFVTLLAAGCGRAEVGAHQVAIVLASFTYMGALGIGGATSARVGRAIGAGVSPRMPGLLGIGLGILFMGGSASVFALVPESLALLLTPDRTVLPIAVKLIYIAACFQLFDGVAVVTSSALRGTGDTRAPFVANLLAYWGLAIPIGFTLGVVMKMGAIGLWWGLTVGLVTVSIALFARFWHRSSRPIDRF
jgi:MATE family multidrug resistance protein